MTQILFFLRVSLLYIWNVPSFIFLEILKHTKLEISFSFKNPTELNVQKSVLLLFSIAESVFTFADTVQIP